MPWRVVAGGGTCEASEFAVVNKDTGRTMGCHPTRRRALAQLAALNANVDETERLKLSSDRILEAAARVDKWRKSRAIEEQGADRVGRIFRVQGRLFGAEVRQLRDTFTESSLREAPPRDAWERAWRRVERRTEARFADDLAWVARSGLAAGAEAVLTRIGSGLSLDLQNPRAIAYIERHGADLVTRINATTRDRLRRILTDAVEKGWSYTRTARAITTHFAEMAVRSPLTHIASRAELIAVTETAFAYEQGNRLAAAQLRRDLPRGAALRKQWITAGDSRVDEEQCGPNEAEGWIPFEESHTSGHGEPPAHPGCRCTEAYEVVNA